MPIRCGIKHRFPCLVNEVHWSINGQVFQQPLDTASQRFPRFNLEKDHPSKLKFSLQDILRLHSIERPNRNTVILYNICSVLQRGKEKLLDTIFCFYLSHFHHFVEYNTMTIKLYMYIISACLLQQMGTLRISKRIRK